MRISDWSSDVCSSDLAYRQLNGLMNTPAEGPEGEPLVLAATEGRIEFRNVHFRYPGAPEKALEGVSFTLEPGEHVALLGRVGSGKSTVPRLLLGLSEPEERIILLDSPDIRQLDPLTLRPTLARAIPATLLPSGPVPVNT